VEAEYFTLPGKHYAIYRDEDYRKWVHAPREENYDEGNN
jgi:hypothetical protein